MSAGEMGYFQIERLFHKISVNGGSLYRTEYRVTIQITQRKEKLLGDANPAFS